MSPDRRPSYGLNRFDSTTTMKLQSALVLQGLLQDLQGRV